MAFDDGKTVGREGPERGVILEDQEHIEGARITLERTEEKRTFRSPLVRYAITCGLYGWMVHTRFFDREGEARQAFEEMKVGLSELITLVPQENDPAVEEKMRRVTAEIEKFVKTFP